MKKVLILYTGGTIGMDYTENGLHVVPGLFNSQIKALAPVANVELDLIEYSHLIDSSDISIPHWVKIIKDIEDAYAKYDGFVVIHGTDTMAYTASLLAFALNGLKKPVILTGAQLPLVHRRSDGWSNLIDAIYSATQADLHEVAIAFNHKLFRGCRAQKVSTNRFIGFDSVDEEPLAEFGINISWYKKRWFKSKTSNFSPIFPDCSVRVLMLGLSPGYTTDCIADILANNQTLQGVVLQTYGSGTIPLHHEKLATAIKQACKRGVIIVSVTQVIEGRISNRYTNSKLGRLGIVSGCDMTPEAALAKLSILIATKASNRSIKIALGRNIAGELTKDYD